MSTFTELLPATKSEQHAAFTWEPATDNAASPVAGVITISGKRSWCRYRLEEFPADCGRGFMFLKLADGTDETESHYSCLLAADGQHACECKGFIRHGHCKHIASLIELATNKRI